MNETGRSILKIRDTSYGKWQYNGPWFKEVETKRAIFAWVRGCQMRFLTLSELKTNRIIDKNTQSWYSFQRPLPTVPNFRRFRKPS
jgi:hypothetical protein